MEWRIGLTAVAFFFNAALAGAEMQERSECVEKSYPHDSGAFTQGLVFYKGRLLESTGRYGRSTVRLVELATGQILLNRALPPDMFAEGLALHKGILYQLTWHNDIVLKYDPETLEPLGRISINGEAWGLASNGEILAMSNGSAVVRYINPENFEEDSRIVVRDHHGEVSGLNELEFVEGLLFANIYPTDEVVMIEPATGKVTGRLDLGRYARKASHNNRDNATNGIAYNAVSRCLLVTGKHWTEIYQIAVPLSQR